MNRLTKRNKSGGIDVDNLVEAAEKLARYEDTGFEPEEINKLVNAFRLLKEMLRTLKGEDECTS